MKKRSLLLCLALVLSLSAAISGTLAYLTDTEMATNVMVVGNVDIEQHEQKRADQTDETFDGLIDYTDGEPLYPAVYEDALLEEGRSGLWTSSEITGALDKIVSVENVGASEAYYRTIFAFEKIDEEMLLINKNTTDYTWEKVEGDVVIDGVTYTLWVATPVEPILAAKATSPYSLYQVAMSKAADNEVVKAIGSEYNILVASQAVQTQNFSDAASAFSAAFAGQVTAANNPWKTNGADNEDAVEPSPMVYIHTVEDLKAFAADVNAGNDYKGAIVKLTNDLDLQNEEWQPIGIEAGGEVNFTVGFAGVFDGQNHTISNLRMVSTGDDDKPDWRRGLFGTIENATIQNLNIHNAEVRGNKRSGLLVGESQGTNNYYNISFTGLIQLEVIANEAGLIVGRGDIGEIKNVTVDVEEGSYVKCTVTNNKYWEYIGGLWGHTWPKVAENITSNINVSGYASAIGGIGGGAAAKSSNITCTGDVTVAIQDSETHGAFQCWNTNGLIYGFGANNTANFVHTNCVATGTLTIGDTVTDNGMQNDNRFGVGRYAQGIYTVIDNGVSTVYPITQ